MGRPWGTFAHFRNIVYIRVSPHEQRCAYTWKEFVDNTARNVRNLAPYIVPTWGSCYLVYAWAQREHEKFCRKNPEDYVNDK